MHTITPKKRNARNVKFATTMHFNQRSYGCSTRTNTFTLHRHVYMYVSNENVCRSNVLRYYSYCFFLLSYRRLSFRRRHSFRFFFFCSFLGNGFVEKDTNGFQSQLFIYLLLLLLVVVVSTMVNFTMTVKSQHSLWAQFFLRLKWMSTSTLIVVGFLSQSFLLSYYEWNQFRSSLLPMDCVCVCMGLCSHHWPDDSKME